MGQIRSRRDPARLAARAAPGVVLPSMKSSRVNVTGGSTGELVPVTGPGLVTLVKKITINNGMSFPVGYILGSNNGHCYAYPGVLRPQEVLEIDTAIGVTNGENLTLYPTLVGGLSAAAGGTSLQASCTYEVLPLLGHSTPTRVAYALAITNGGGGVTMIGTNDTNRLMVTQVWLASRGPAATYASMSVGGVNQFHWTDIQPGRPLLVDIHKIVEPGQGLIISQPSAYGASLDAYLFGYIVGGLG